MPSPVSAKSSAINKQNACRYAHIRNKKGRSAQTGKINEISSLYLSLFTKTWGLSKKSSPCGQNSFPIGFPVNIHRCRAGSVLCFKPQELEYNKIRQLYHHSITSTGCRLLQSVLFSYSADRSGNFHYGLIEPLQVPLVVCLHAGSRAGDADGGCRRGWLELL